MTLANRARSTVDASAEFQVDERRFVFLTAQNLFNASGIFLRYDSATPACARQHRNTVLGTQISLGVKGSY